MNIQIYPEYFSGHRAKGKSEKLFFKVARFYASTITRLATQLEEGKELGDAQKEEINAL